jgi:C4-dicarboxylate-specific signal transduction histidine kinase
VGGARPAYLVCLRQEEGFFGQSHLGLGLRFSIVANQAFLNEEERQKVVQSSKLAMLGEVSAGIAHEISQPLTAIKLAAQNIELMIETPEGPPVDKLQSKVERILSSVERSVKIVQSMRVLSRQSDGAQAPFNVKEAVGEATSIVQHKLTAASVRLSVDIPESLIAHGRRLEFSQVVLNAVSNSIDAIQSAKGKNSGSKSDRSPEVEIRSRLETDGSVTLTIRDTGPGVPKHLLDKVMDPFFTTKDVGKGTGLGLALCKRMMEAMSGEITINNWDGGAEVRLRLQGERHNLHERDGSNINGAV